MSSITIKRALISTTNKQGIVALARRLDQLGVVIIATAGTADYLRRADISVVAIETVTGFPEMMSGRVKTLHPNIHGALLGRQGVDDAAMKAHGISPIDLLIVNLYPFQEVVADSSVEYLDAIEQIDVGGPAMLRAAAKNHERVTVLVDPEDYPDVLEAVAQQGSPPLETRRYLAQKAFAHTANYDAAIARYLTQPSPNYDQKTLTLCKKSDLKYGENPHQKAELYFNNRLPHSLVAAEQKQGPTLSFNNYADGSVALHCVRALDPEQPACVMIKHMTPCGAAQEGSLKQAYLNALAADPVSAFGGVVAVNRTLDAATAAAMVENQFIEVLLVPQLEPSVLEILATKKKLRVLVTGFVSSITDDPAESSWHSIYGGLLRQDLDEQPDDPSTFTVASQRQPTPEEWRDCLFAWKIVRYVKSNAIVYAKNLQTVGIGSGQPSRVLSAIIAAWKAQEVGFSLEGAVAASDAFYPFSDGVSTAAEQGVTAIIQPGGSKRDSEVIEVANQFNVAMIMTGVRHFRH